MIKIQMTMKRNECLFNADGMGHTLMTLNSKTIIQCVSIEEFTGKHTHMHMFANKLMKITLEDGRYFTLSTLVYTILK